MVASARSLTLTVYCFIASAPFHGWAIVVRLNLLHSCAFTSGLTPWVGITPTSLPLGSRLELPGLGLWPFLSTSFNHLS